MSSHTLSPSSPFIPSFFNNFDTNTHSHHSRENSHEISEQQNRTLKNLNTIQNQSLNDSYTPSKQSGTRNVQNIESRTLVQSVDTRVSRSAELEITTKEGDTVKISFNQLATSSRNEFEIEQGNNKISGYQENNSFRSNFEIKIDGDLNENEQKSLNSLLNQLYKVSDEFFNGKVATAFEHAQKVGFDTDQLTSFSLDLLSEKKVQAVAAYQQTSLPDQNVNTDLLKQASSFLAQTKEFLADNVATLDTYTEPRQAFTDLFSTVASLLSNDSENASQENSLLKFIDNITKDLKF